MMKNWYKSIIGFLIAFLLCFSFLPDAKVLAESTYPFVEDDADLLTDSEEKALSEKIEAIRKKYNADVVILTADDLGWRYTTQYIEDYYDTMYAQGKINENATILYIDISDRTLEIQGYGACEEFISPSRGDNIRDAMGDELHYNNFYEGYLIGLNKVSTYLGRNPNFLTWTWLHLLVALIIGTIVTIVMVSHSKGKVTTSSRTYLDQAHSGLTAKRDIYLNTTVRKVRIESSSSGGSHSSGRSSGGHSHSTSKGHF